MRKTLTVAAIAAASSIAFMGGQAGALSSGSLVPAVVLPSPSLQLSGTCVPEFVAAGVGSTGGLPYKVQGVGYSSADSPATQVECRFWDTDNNSLIQQWASGYKAGPAAELAVDYTVKTLDNFVTCVRVDRIDPVTGVVHSTAWTSSSGAYCGT